MSVVVVSGYLSVVASGERVASAPKTKVRCEALIKPEGGGPLKKCNKVVDVALQAVKCNCEKFHCKKHFNRIAHDCPLKADATRSVAKSYFFGPSSQSSNQAY